MTLKAFKQSARSLGLWNAYYESCGRLIGDGAVDNVEVTFAEGGHKVAGAYQLGQRTTFLEVDDVYHRTKVLPLLRRFSSHLSLQGKDNLGSVRHSLTVSSRPMSLLFGAILSPDIRQDSSTAPGEAEGAGIGRR